MALLIDDTGEFVDHGSAAVLDDVFTGTMCSWFYLDALPATSAHPQRIIAKGNNWLFGTANSANMIGSFVRATQSLLAFAPFANFTPNVQTGRWLFGAFTFDSAGANGDQKLLIGDLSTPASEPSAYTIQRVGSGAVTSNAAANLYGGNNVDATTECLEGKQAFIGVWNRILSLNEILAQQWFPRYTTGCILFSHYHGTGTQPDLSGNGNNGAVTGATVADHVPLGPPFGFDFGWQGAITVAAAAQLTPESIIHSQAWQTSNFW